MDSALVETLYKAWVEHRKKVHGYFSPSLIDIQDWENFVEELNQRIKDNINAGMGNSRKHTIRKS